ncbi:MAG: hypothetical protein AAGB34_05065 [Planctomycetota bacterium]
MRKRAFATMLVLLVVSVASLVLISLQRTAFRHAAVGRDVVARTNAYWAARAGVETVIAQIAFETESEPTGDALTLTTDLAAISEGEFQSSSYVIVHSSLGRFFFGPEDPHMKINVNRMSIDDLMELPNMTEDVAGAIVDWIDADEIINEFGAEAAYYLQNESPYLPRNGPVRTLQELELVVGVNPTLLRGEDWNLNGQLDPNENDGDVTFPPDDEDGRLDAGWSMFITAESVEGTLTPDGLPKLDLTTADNSSLTDRVERLTSLQATALLQWAQRGGDQDGQPRIEQLVANRLRDLAEDAGVENAENVPDLDDAQLRQALDELTISAGQGGLVPGRVNLNTVERETLDYLSGIPSGQADMLIYLRDRQPGGFTSWVDVGRAMRPQSVESLSQILTLESTAFVVTARGIDANTGVEVEISATIERTGLPLVISEMMVR